MTAELERVFARYGTTVRIEQTGKAVYTAKAFVQPMGKSGKEYPFTVTGLGSVDDRHWLCLTIEALEEGDCVWFNQKCYEAVNCTEICAAEQSLYWKTILRSEQEAAV